MALMKKLIAMGLILVSIAVALHFMFTPFYPDSVDVSEIWDILDWFMAAAMAVTLIVHYLRKRVFDAKDANGSITREYLEVNVALYASIALTLWFFWNWFDNLTVGAGPQSDTNLINWMLIDPLLVIVFGVTGCHLLRDASRE